ncbi:hypothetical protein L1785_15470 [Antribacter sp. KLBMP9083]|uniref:Uncharacterized protein n=1 Tax=Antribacter soli TaxID=2910976 RepID=A0AA41QFV9_9MICO|nr:hypothetical protein [Antribacter soli]MCF4122377.1 hypothetical protein [Antribacter soli]
MASPWRRARAWTVFVLALVLEVAGGAGFSVDRPPAISRMPVIPPEDGADIPDVHLWAESGVAPWMPARWADRPAVVGTTSGARVEPPGLPRPVQLDPRLLWLVEASPQESRRPERFAAEPWRARVRGRDAEGREVDVVLAGTWASLAWLGHLGGWPDPTVTPLPPVTAPEPDAWGNARA